jgi:hypothetical protein
MTIGIVSTFSLKGGVGKTSISLAVQLELQKKGSAVKIITNDPVSPIGAVLDENDFVQLSKKQNFPKDLQKKGDWILDMGGYLDNRILPILKQSKTIIIPTFTDYRFGLFENWQNPIV